MLSSHVVVVPWVGRRDRVNARLREAADLLSCAFSPNVHHAIDPKRSTSRAPYSVDAERCMNRMVYVYVRCFQEDLLWKRVCGNLNLRRRATKIFGMHC